MTDAPRAIVLAAALLALAFGWLTVRTVRLPVSSHERLVAELRMTQFASLILMLVAGAYIGFAAWQESRPSAGLDAAIALGFFAAAVTALTRDPRQALTALAAAFAAHALVDVMHRPGWLLPDAAPRWYAVGCAVFNVLSGACCYLPVVWRGQSETRDQP